MDRYFSKRTGWDLTENDVTQALHQRKQQKDFIDLTVSNPTQCSIDLPYQDIIGALASPQNSSYDPSAKGMLSARQVVVQYYRSKNITVDPEQIFLTSSTSEAYSFLFRLLADPDDEVAFPRPSYPLFQFLSDINDVQTCFYSLKYNKQWLIDEESFSESITEKTKAIIIVNPNNPTGSYLKVKELKGLSDICRQRHMSLLSDEVFFDFPIEDAADKISTAGHKECLTFTMGGISKALALPQMKLSWIIVSGPDDLVGEAVKRLEMIADIYLSVSTPIQNALASLFAMKDPIQASVSQRINDNYSHLKGSLKDHPKVHVLKTEGGWYAVLETKDLDEDDLVSRLLSEKSLFVHPGFFYEFHEGSHLVLSLLPPIGLFQEGISRLNDFLLKS